MKPMAKFDPDIAETSAGSPAWLGCVADDVTGATDLAINLVQGGLRVVQFLSIPTAEELAEVDCDAVVVGMKTRSILAEDAIAKSMAAIDTLRKHGCQRFFFKYCSTFDSTPQGNIGPVADALLEQLNERAAIVCPAFPRNQRTVYRGHLFVGDRLLNNSGMEHHPLNPMTDSDIVRFLGAQSVNRTGLVDFDVVHAGSAAIEAQIQRLVDSGVRLLVTDCCNDSDLGRLAEAVKEMRLVTGGSGIGRYLPEAWRNSGLLTSSAVKPRIPNITGRSLVLAGSCSRATRRQVQNALSEFASFEIDVAQLMRDPSAHQKNCMHWIDSIGDENTRPAMVYSTANDETVERTQREFGRDSVCGAIENFHAFVAKTAVQRLGFRRLIVAGGETSGAVVKALEIKRLKIGAEICAGVPWTESDGDPALAIALKSGNFGDDNFFKKALDMLP
jgi:uncharacterized protein YgbK (DUF1537 family)